MRTKHCKRCGLAKPHKEFPRARVRRGHHCRGCLAIMRIEPKVCPQCKKLKPLTDYYPNPKQPDCVERMCKVCRGANTMACRRKPKVCHHCGEARDIRGPYCSICREYITNRKEKPCSTCGVVKPLADYQKKTIGFLDGHNCMCRSCQTAADKKCRQRFGKFCKSCHQIKAARYFDCERPTVCKKCARVLPPPNTKRCPKCERQLDLSKFSKTHLKVAKHCMACEITLANEGHWYYILKSMAK